MSAFCDMLYAFNNPILYALKNVPAPVQDRAQEIRLRVGLPLVLTVDNKTAFVKRDGGISNRPDGNCYIVTYDDILQTVSRLCDGSIYSYEGQLRNGYLSLKNGCRAGVCGCFSDFQNGNLRCYTSVNIRIANQVKFCSKPIIDAVGQGPHNILLVGPPGSSKTTMLRDLVRQYSYCGFRVSVADERGEISAMHQGGSAFDLGYNVDVMTDINKGFAVQALLKYFNPQIIAFDELSDDADTLKACMSSGVRFITTLHSDSITNAISRLNTLKIDIGLFDVLVLLDSEKLGQVKELCFMGDRYEMDRNIDDIVGTCDHRLAQIQPDAKVSRPA